MFINATGAYVPAERVHNDYFLNVNGLTDEWILQRTGISTRSKAAADENTNTMGIAAVKNALPNLPYNVEEVDLIIGASYSPYDTVATLAHVAQKEFGIANAKGFYLSSACSSFVNAVEVAECFFAAGKATKALIIASEHNTAYSNEADPQSGHLWGDAAVAVFVSKDKMKDGEAEIIDVFSRSLGTVGKSTEGVYLRPRTEGLVMPDGRDVFINATKYMCEALNTMTANHGKTTDDLTYIITHQANKRIVANVANHLNVSLDKFINNIHELGNTGSPSAMIVVSQNWDKFKQGDLLGLTVFGGGYSSGGLLIQF
ncbi:3-oxoacyl-ACP synthase III family protein [Parabacteroides sp. FAFU027]|uniref:3-oxoacyl-ACP synthase III family protein n=1 Tax=Parabacteroides sp. FAFU027 TaxID=2922715 RepID=UPI001FAEAC68|nr:3-oxoacyl-ACP synthase III family protein [Parabacteroides sp. FAFU027]